VVKTLGSDSDKSFDSVSNFYFLNGYRLLLETTRNREKALQIISIVDSSAKTIWSGDEKSLPGNYVFSKDGFAFTVVQAKSKSIWYCDTKNNAVELTNQYSLDIATGFTLNGINYRGFSADGKRIFIDLT